MKAVISSYGFWVILFAGLFSFAAAQHTPYRQYTTLDGLPSNHVYCSVQDARGILWIATDQGIARFDGQSFRVYTTADGLPTNDIYDLHRDKWDRIWMRGFTNRLVYLERDSVKEMSTASIPGIDQMTSIDGFAYTYDGRVVLTLRTKKLGGYPVLCERDSIRSLATLMQDWRQTDLGTVSKVLTA